VTKVSKSVLISRTPQEVFTYLADFTNTAEWDPGVAEATKTSAGPVGFGSGTSDASTRGDEVDGGSGDGANRSELLAVLRRLHDLPGHSLEDQHMKRH